ncbi:hypothetical protein HKD37_13G037833 [Glycine soja]|uniref:Uncharacterized protein n=1 Tax=Glycine soja TaxID=3848 RepID=A0A445IAG2_GLYSO|nr:uncharacterized protein LOC114372928 [Glycine soja]RZB83039.1 hypothetical protein D0Y65_031886 [Glycine soja]
MGIFSTLFSRRTLSLSLLKIPSRPTSSQPAPTPTPTPTLAGPTKKPLHVLFTQALGLSQKPTPSDEEEETASETLTELKNNLKQLEQEIKTFKDSTKDVTLKSEKKKQKMSLFAVFTNKQREPKPKEESLAAAKKLSPDVAVFVQYLFKKGYFNDANFAKGRKNFNPDWFSNVFALGYIKFAANKFARDHREIAKWLSGSALKQVAVFGCPYPHRSGVFPAKSLRKFFEVPENTVCSGCALQQSCKFANRSVWKCDDTNNLDFLTVMKVITPYALESVHPQLEVPDEVKKSVSQLLKEVVKLSQTT